VQAVDRHTGGTPRAHAEDQQAVGSQVDRRAQGVHLAHGAVAEVLLTDLDGRKQQRDGGARHQVIERQLGAAPDALHPCPVADGVDAVVEGDRAAGAVAGGAQRERPQVPARDAAADAGAIDMHAEQFAQRRVVEHRPGR